MKTLPYRSQTFCWMISAFILFLTLSIFLIYHYFVFHQTPSIVFQIFKDSLYNPNYNLFVIKKINSVEATSLIYLLFLTSLILFLIGRRLLNLSSDLISRKILLTSILLCLLITFLQNMKAYEYYLWTRNFLGKKPLKERNQILFPKVYPFVEETKRVLPHSCQATLVSDADFSQFPLQGHKAILAYHLYPEISFRFQSSAPSDCLILFHKNEPEKSLPQNYRILYSSEDKTFIFAMENER